MKEPLLRISLLLLCIPSGGILLLKMYGIVEMNKAAISILLPATILLVLVYVFLLVKRNGLAKIVIIGFLGGLLGTLGYDLVRIPFMLIGSQIFAPINMYGMWLTDATMSSPYTDTIGWLYHFYNGITFGIVYALFMTGKPIVWAILYALLLETIFVLSPFGELFGITQKPVALFAAYLGHVAYGYPLGKMVRNYDSSIKTIKYFKNGLSGIFVFLGLACIAIVIVTKIRSQDNSTLEFVISDTKIYPKMIRINKGSIISFNNNSATDLILSGTLLEESLTVSSDDQIGYEIVDPGIYHLIVKRNKRLDGIFILCEPVENFK